MGQVRQLRVLLVETDLKIETGEEYLEEDLDTLRKSYAMTSVFGWAHLSDPLSRVLAELSGTVEVLDQVRQETEDVQRETYKRQEDILQNETEHAALIRSVLERRHARNSWYVIRD